MIGNVVVTADFTVLDNLIREIGGKHVRIVHDGVKYGLFQEFGTRKMAARPWMTPAMEHFREPFLEGCKRLDNLTTMAKFMDKLAGDATTYIKNSFGDSPAPPGGPPGVDTGTLKKSIAWERGDEL